MYICCHRRPIGRSLIVLFVVFDLHEISRQTQFYLNVLCALSVHSFIRHAFYSLDTRVLHLNLMRCAYDVRMRVYVYRQVQTDRPSKMCKLRQRAKANIRRFSNTNVSTPHDLRLMIETEFKTTSGIAGIAISATWPAEKTIFWIHLYDRAYDSPHAQYAEPNRVNSFEDLKWIYIRLRNYLFEFHSCSNCVKPYLR